MELLHARSLLFCPGDDARKLEKALASAADAVVCDLEDAVAPADKASARETVATVLRGRIHGSDPRICLRVNAVGTPPHADDLALAAELPLDAIVLPKASVAAVDSLGPDGPPVIAIVETATALRGAYEIASCDRVVALVLGAVDLGAEVGLEPRPDAQEILYARSKVSFDSAAATVRGPFDVVHLETRDEAGLEEQCKLARALGFRGKACIHPGQVETINRVFSPTEEDAAWARKVIDAFEEQSGGVLALNGAMVDLPVVERARRILQDAERSTNG